MMKNKPAKKHILIAIVCLTVVAAACMLLYRRHATAPERTVEKVLNEMAAGIPDPSMELNELIEQLETRYQPYFTKEAFEQAMRVRDFTAFRNQNPGFEGAMAISSLNFEPLDSSPGDTSLYATFQLDCTPADGTPFTQKWSVQIRLVQEEGRWVIRYMRLKKMEI